MNQAASQPGAEGGGGRRHARADVSQLASAPGPIARTPTAQFADLVLAPVDVAQLPALRTLLGELGRQTIGLMKGEPVERPLLPFSRVQGLHFARFVLFDAAEDVARDEAYLAFAVDYDGPEGEQHCRREQAYDAFFHHLLAELGAGLQTVFSHCKKFERQRLAGYLNEHRRRACASFVGAPGRSVRQIRAEALLRRSVDQFMGSHAFTNESPAQVRALVLEALEAGSYPDGIAPFPAQPDRSFEITKVKLGLAGAGLTVLATLSIPFGPGGAVLLLGLTAAGLVARFRFHERTDQQFQPKLDAATHAAFEVAAQDENWFLQNQLSHVVELKPGPMRWLLIRAVFATLQLLADSRYNDGELGGIPSIHFARWVLGPRDKVIFFSNFDSSWQSYLGDFIDKASAGLSAVWSNTKGYPRTTWLTRAGSRDAGRFLAWTRAHQIPSQVWYSAYPGLSVSNINANTVLRRGLASPHEVDAFDWLMRLRNVDRADVARRYEQAKASKQREAQAKKARAPRHEERVTATPATAARLPMHDIQGIILKGYGHKPEARYLLLALGDPSCAPQVRRWISRLPITSAQTGARDRRLADPLLNIAFSYEGMKALGLEQTLCDGFSTAFVQGSHHAQRARINGDVGGDAPSEWSWGSGPELVHMALLVFGESNASLDIEVDKLLQSLTDSAGAQAVRLIATLEATTLPGRKEHFGFRDGIAQPTLLGSGDPEIEGSALAAGEVLLGHRDGYGNLAQIPQSREGFGFGVNGSYMVLRQLEQDVPAFWRYCAAQAAACSRTAEQVAAKLVGRWPSGAPLVRAPHSDPQPGGVCDEDHFGYFEVSADHDGYGSRCPFGAHIRRANPRDWGLGQNSDESRRLSGLHRIMRRGRPYGPVLTTNMSTDELIAAAHDERHHDNVRAGKSEAASERAPVARGLHFMCFNANIERQFEFIQQQWCKNPKFAGQASDADPLLGMHGPASALGINDPGFTFQGDGQTGFAKRLLEAEPFVHVRGSGYFFMPSLSALRLLEDHLCSPSPPPEQNLGDQTEPIPDDEQVHTERLTDNIRVLLQRRYPDVPTLRDAHPKMHGCVRAELIPHPSRARELRHGVFAEGVERYRGWVRFSNEHQDPQPDHKKDTRGLALKLCDVPGKKLLDGEEDSRTHDFVFLSTPAFIARDVAEFDELINGLVQRSLPSWLRSLKLVQRLWRSRAQHTSPLEITYYSVVPALLGAEIVKYTVAPRDPNQTPVARHPSPDYLRETMKRQLEERAYELDVFVQRFQNKRDTPIEDASVSWQERDAPRELIATLRILQQDDFDSDERRAFGENLAFNPFRCLPAHRPLGGISRARRTIYRAIASFRHTRNRVEPSEPSAW